MDYGLLYLPLTSESSPSLMQSLRGWLLHGLGSADRLLLSQQHCDSFHWHGGGRVIHLPEETDRQIGWHSLASACHTSFSSLLRCREMTHRQPVSRCHCNLTRSLPGEARETLCGGFGFLWGSVLRSVSVHFLYICFCCISIIFSKDQFSVKIATVLQ